MMPVPDNLHVRAQKDAQRVRFAEGVNDGVEAAAPYAMRAWVLELYATRGSYDRGYLLGVLLEEWQRLEGGA